jgi:hypothetical protein
MSQKIAEVIESSTRQFVAEVYREADPPAFGTWVRVPHDRGITLFGLVSHVEIRSLEPNRQARALGKTLEELRREYPQIPDLLTTTFRAQVIAYADDGGRVRQTLPPHPAGVHDFIYPCASDEVEHLGRPFDFLRTLVSSPDPSVPVDDLLVAVLTNLHTAHGGRHGGDQALVAAGRALSRLLDDDHERLQSILRRVG